MEKVSIVIPNYNGAHLLQKNLPQVIKNCPNSEIIVVDDASVDESVKLIKKKFKKVKLILLKKNKGFANAANAGVYSAREKKVLLLNSDVSPRKNFLKPAFKFFKDPKTFAVGLEDQSHESGKIIPRGRGGATFKRGFIEHFSAPAERGYTFWTSGGSMLFDKKKFIELSGFDPIYKPFYWEDIDLGFRAWRSGYMCYFEPLSKVDHFHEEGSIKKTYSQFKVKSISYKNQFIFVWKNINDLQLVLLHYFWLPVHILKALSQANFSFLFGLGLATISIPRLIKTKTPTRYPVSEREVIKIFQG